MLVNFSKVVIKEFILKIYINFLFEKFIKNLFEGKKIN